jgi:hypothetical protein
MVAGPAIVMRARHHRAVEIDVAAINGITAIAIVVVVVICAGARRIKTFIVVIGRCGAADAHTYTDGTDAHADVHALGKRRRSEGQTRTDRRDGSCCCKADTHVILSFA